ncbi:MAG TPA: glucosamine-6-phosphate deaminase [Candidatus Microbacterium stercoravium]|uniref:Glucosamine-6-phosphate deaminase n=1 Tax=Candidatus Microbacterium stercoravium TaxID=2838697 RepID=A0A9D2H6L2_9MICO|nr:glucosamine-6-phosphate deaminase [Candidatus Microbacterium stercoravium]
MAEVVIVSTPADAGRLAAESIERRLAASERPVLGVATGSTPLETYRALAERGTDLTGVTAFALDEYVGLPDGHPEGYRAVLEREFCEVTGFDPSRLNVPDASVEGLETAGPRYESLISEAGGIDVQILGIGTDGHIGFNEPGSSLASRTRVKTLAGQTRRDNARFFASIDEVPIHCVTQGLGTIRDARHLILLAFGPSKANAIRAALEGPVSSSVPASLIQLHPSVTVLIDEPCAAKLEHADYYRMAYDNKPSWQTL